jgi:hypothetical protein
MDLLERQEEFLITLQKSMGVVSTALQNLHIPREEYDTWIKNNEFKKKIEKINELTLDYVENQLLKKIYDGDLTAIQFYLKTKGKKRGY